MFVIKLLEISFAVFLMAMLVTQVGIPLWRETLLFPWFRKEKALEDQIAAEKQEELERQLRKKLGDLKVVEVPAATINRDPS